MALLDFLKNKSSSAKATEGQRKRKDSGSPAKSLVAKPDSNKSEKTKAVKEVIIDGVKKSGFSYDAVKSAHISEKGTYLAEKNQYIFKVASDFNKKELKNSIEGIYKVNVLSVNTVKIPPKKRRLGRTEGFKKGYKKAIVTIKEGQKIETI